MILIWASTTLAFPYQNKKGSLAMRLILTSALLALGLSAPLGAQTFEAVNRLIVVPLNAAEFEVIEARGEGARGLWCAAADYALRKGGSGRLYVSRARGRSVSGAGRIGVTFTLDETRLSAAPFRSYSVSVNAVGENLPVRHAYQFCKDYLLEPDNIFFSPRRLED